jgi:hypothetical protein
MFILLIFLFGLNLQAQKECKNCDVDFECLQGLFREVFVSSSLDIEKLHNYELYDSTYRVGIHYKKGNGDSASHSITFLRIGFIDELEKDSAFPTDIRMNGKYYVTMPYNWEDDKKEKIDYGTGMFSIYCDGDGYELGNFVGPRIRFLPVQIWNVLLEQGKQDDRDYVKLFNLQRFSPFDKVLNNCAVYRDNELTDILFEHKGVSRVNVINIWSWFAEVEFIDATSIFRKGWVYISAIE